ncbi:type II toxin-antitoxin system HigB family toxin [Nostoc sp.]
MREFCQHYADSCDALNNWYKAANKATWNNLARVQAVYPQAEAVGNFTVFNIKGNKYRLIVGWTQRKKLKGFGVASQRNGITHL